MRPGSLVTFSAAVPVAWAWGGLGHITIAYLATNLVADDTASYFQGLLRNHTDDYLAGVATWADSVRYTRWGRFTEPFHFIDAKDSPPSDCSIDFDRDCKAEGCVVSALQNYTGQLLDASLRPSVRAQAAKFVVHFIGDIHQPLHTEDLARGGNDIHVLFDDVHLNLHHVWDSSIPEKMVGGVRRRPYPDAKRWAAELTAEVKSGKYREPSLAWLDGINVNDAKTTALRWATEGNAHVCSTVLPQGPRAIMGRELGSDYFKTAAPVVEIQVARAGYRLAAWLDQIARKIKGDDQMSDL